jgi:hypothetical protein
MRLIFFILLLIPSVCFSQTEFRVNYNKIVDYDGKKRKEYIVKGTWYLSKDSILVQKYDRDSLVYNVIEIKNKHVYYMNNYDEVVDVLFMNKMVSVKNSLRPNEYLIFKEN